MEIIVGICFAIILVVFYHLITRNKNYWKNKNIPEFASCATFFGHLFPYLINAENYHTTLKRVYDQLSKSGHRYGGTFEMLRPVFIICDPKMLVEITAKYSNKFAGRDASWLFNPQNRGINPLSDNLVSNEGQRWKILRQKQNPVFTLSKYRKVLYEHAIHNLNEMQDMLAELKDEIEVKHLCLKYMVDVIGSWGFDIECSSYREPNSEFLKYARMAFKNNYKLRHAILGVFPRIIEWLKIPDFNTDVTEFYLNLVRNTIRYRKENNIRREDYLDVLMDIMAEENKTEPFDELDVAANAFVTLIVGYDSTATTLAYVLYEIVVNKQVQDKLRDEMMAIKCKHNDFTLEALSELKYLDMVIDETLRKYPTDSAIFRLCTERWQIPDTNSWIDPGTLVLMPTLGFHWDPKYFAEPEKFNPERFSAQNKGSIPSGVYFPYGEGSRICIALRTAQLLMKVAIVKIVSKYELLLSSKTDIPLPFVGGSFMLVPENGIWIKISKLECDSLTNER